MNISVTNKKMLKGLVALAVVCASAQTFAAPITSDSFESYTTGDAITNAAPTVWQNEGNGLSTVLATNYTYTAATMPLSASAPATAHTQILGLDTQGDQLSNVQATGDAPSVYVDQMVYLVPSDSAPTISDDSAQAAVYLNSNSNLVVLTTHQVDASTATNAWAVLDNKTVEPETWVRLTITVDYDSGDDDGFGIYTDWLTVAVDGTNLTSSTLGYPAVVTTLASPSGGMWLRCANQGGASVTEDSLAGLAYTGTGMIDDLIVTTTTPTFEEGTGPSTFSILSVVGANGGISSDLDFEIAAGGSTSITFTADQYYEIASLEINGAPATDGGGTPYDFAGNHIAEVTVSYTSVGADVSNNVAFTETLSDLSSAPASWFEPLGLTAAGDDGSTPYSYMEGYVAGVNPTVSNAFTIVSYSVSGGELTVEWDGVDSPATPTAVSALVSEVVDGTPVTEAGSASFSSDTWTWTSSSSDITNGTLFIKLQASDD